MSSIKRKCRNMTAANKFISNILRNFNEGDIVNDKFIMELVEYHPTKKIKLENVEWLMMKNRPPYFTTALYYKNKGKDEDDDISWKLCIRNLYGKFDNDKNKLDDITKAFRFETYFGFRPQFFLDNTTNRNGVNNAMCVKCGDYTSDIHIDHFGNPFKNILKSFLKDNNINIEDLGVYETDTNEIRLKCEDTATKWLKYHDSKATYRVLCRSCNIGCGAYGF